MLSFRLTIRSELSSPSRRLALFMGLKWQAYGYKDMFYFGLKIMQIAGTADGRDSQLSVFHFQRFETVS